MTKVLSTDHFLYAYLLRTAARWCLPGQRVLDVGCGVGPVALFLADRGLEVVGVELDAQKVTACHQAAEYLGLSAHVQFVQGDFMDVVLQGPFDRIVCFEVLEHLADDGGALAKLRSLMAPEGLLLVSTPSPRDWVHRYRLWRYGRDPFDEAAGHLRRYTAPQLVARLREAGFEAVELQFTEGLTRNVLPLTAAGRLVLRGVRGWLTPLAIALDRAVARAFGEGQVIVVARAV